VGRSVVSKAAVILLCFRDGMSHSLTEVVDVTGLPRSTAYRLICELVTWRLLERADDCGYRLGLPLRPGSGGRREFHPPAPTDPGVTVSRHRALATLLTRRT
jgi:IclR helix-turn-helix domain